MSLHVPDLVYTVLPLLNVCSVFVFDVSCSLCVNVATCTRLCLLCKYSGYDAVVTFTDVTSRVYRCMYLMLLTVLMRPRFCCFYSL